MAPIRVLLSGGGTGGHLVPGLELARRLLARGDRVVLARTGRHVETPFLHDAGGLEVREVPLKGRGPALPIAISRSLGPARRVLHEAAIDVVVGLGGRGSLPCLFAAWTRRVPFVLLEQNVQPGRANRFVSRFARRVYVAFPETRDLLAGDAAVCTGMPLRDGLGRAPDPALVRRFGVAGRRVLLVLGGSQGARALNLGLPPILGRMSRDVRDRVSVIHVAGAGRESETAEAYSGTGLDVHVLAFQVDMASLYAIADLVICRGGGTSLVEIAAAGRPAVVVPFPHHKDRHQAINAAWFEQAGAFRTLDQATLESGRGAELVETLLRDERARLEMGRHARAALPGDGGRRIAEDLHHIAEGCSSVSRERETAS